MWELWKEEERTVRESGEKESPRTEGDVLEELLRRKCGTAWDEALE